MMRNMSITIIIPVKPGGRVTAAERLGNLVSPDAPIEILIAEGSCPSRQRNEAVRAASSDIIYFLDDDSLVPPDFQERLTQRFTDPDVAAVGGPSLSPDSDTLLQKCFSLIFSSFIGGGGMRNRYRKHGKVRIADDSELILCNLAFRKEIFQGFGGFDERLYPNEENELMERVVASGLKLVHDPDLAIYRSHRPSVRAFIKQLFGYGRGRGEQTLLTGNLRPATLVPPVFVMYLLSLMISPLGVYSLPLLCYVLTICFCSVFDSWRGGRALFVLYLPWLYPIFHCCYGAGFLWGITSFRWRQPRLFPPVAIRCVRHLPIGQHIESEG